MGNVQANFIEPVLAHLPLHRDVEAKRFFDDYKRILDKFSDEVLRKAADWFLLNGGKTFPPVREGNAKCEDFQRTADLPRRSFKPKTEDADNWKSKARNAEATELLKGTGMAAIAAEEGWIAHLYDFARQHRRLPEMHEIDGMKRSERSFRAFVAGLDENALPAVHRMVTNMRGHREKLGRELVTEADYA